MMVGQSSFKVETRVIRKDENQKWKKLKREQEVIFDKFEEGTIVNKISNKVMIRKILKRMDKLEMDEEGDFVHHGAPCPFLKGDNKCSVYEARPEACRGYPHTGDKQFRSIMDVTLVNTLYCPAVFEIVVSMKKEFEQ